MAKAVSDLGFKVFDWIQAAISATGDWLNGLQNQEDPTFHNPLHVLSDLWHLLTKGLAKLTFPLLQTLWNGVCMLRRGIGKIGKCDTTTLIGIGVVKLTWDTLKRIQLGSDAGVWATIDTSFELPVIERTLEYLLQYACPPEIPQPSETIEAYLRNQITEEQYRCWLAARGCSFVVWDAVTMSRREQLQPDEWIEWARRHQLPENIQSDGLRWRGWIQGDERAARLELYDELPTIMEHLHWLQRNVFDDEYVKDYDLMNGFEERFWKKFGNDLRAQGMKKEYAALHYAAHWINPAPGQLFEMLRRLRPGRVAKDIQFTETDLLRLLAEQDVAPYFRSRFRAIAYTPFGLRFLRQLYDTRVIDDKEASQRFQDIGYSPQDADLLVKAEVIRRARTVATQTNAYSAKNIRAFYLADEIDIATAKSKLNTLGYPDTVATDAIAAWDLQRYISDIKVGEKESKAMQLAAGKEAYINGTVRDDDLIGLLRDIGWRPNHAEMYTKGLRYKIIQDQTKALISTVRKSYLTGQIDRVQAESALRNITVTPERIGMYLTEWTLQLTVGRKELTAAQIMQKATEGILPVPVALQRLLNLNYTPTDAQLLMLGVQRKIAETEQKMLDAQAKQRAAEARIVMQAQKELQKQLDAIKKRLEQLGSASNLLKWLTDGVIGPEYATARLLALGAAESDVQIAVADALAKGAKASGKAAKAAPPAGGKPKGGGV